MGTSQLVFCQLGRRGTEIARSRSCPGRAGGQPLAPTPLRPPDPESATRAADPDCGRMLASRRHTPRVGTHWTSRRGRVSLSRSECRRKGHRSGRIPLNSARLGRPSL